MTQGPGTYLNLTADGSVFPMSFVKLNPAAGAVDSCLQCGVGDTPIGVTGVWTRYAGGTPANDLENATYGGYEATVGEFPQVASLGCVVPLQAGATGWTSGQRLKPDANGFGVPIAATTDVAGAVALEATPAGAIGRVLVLVAASAGAPIVPLIRSEDDEEESKTDLSGKEHEDARSMTRLIHKEGEDEIKKQEEAYKKLKDEEDKKSKDVPKNKPVVKDDNVKTAKDKVKDDDEDEPEKKPVPAPPLPHAPPLSHPQPGGHSRKS